MGQVKCSAWVVHPMYAAALPMYAAAHPMHEPPMQVLHFTSESAAVRSTQQAAESNKCRQDLKRPSSSAISSADRVWRQCRSQPACSCTVADSCCGTHDVAEGCQGLSGSALGLGGVAISADVVKGGQCIQVLLVAGPHIAASRGVEQNGADWQGASMRALCWAHKHAALKGTCTMLGQLGCLSRVARHGALLLPANCSPVRQG